MSFYPGYGAPIGGLPVSGAIGGFSASPLARSIAPAAPLSYGLPLNTSFAPQVYGAAPLTSSQVYSTGFRTGAVTSVAPYATAPAPLASQFVRQANVIAQPAVIAQPTIIAQPAVSQQYVSQAVVAQPVIQQAAAVSQTIKGHSEIEYIPFEKQYQESVPVERIEYVPVERKYTDYYAIENQVEYVPYTTYNTVKEVVPQARTEYVPQQRVEQVAQTYTEYVPVDRVQQSVDYQAVEKTLVHYPQYDRQFVSDAERSGRIRYGGASLIGAGSYAAPSVAPVAAPVNFSGVYPTSSIVAPSFSAPLVSQLPAPIVNPFTSIKRNEVFPRGRDKESLSKLNDEIKRLEESIVNKRKDIQGLRRNLD